MFNLMIGRIAWPSKNNKFAGIINSAKEENEQPFFFKKKVR